ncbi:SGNH/GDSL hydrolase family protein [Streptomyces sp. AN091965]|uniref:SGNH/GDSL hydrolase family protein n=1 Tax=Streptomyces sp. AN091965 TaxID=2927803 RepID=UPI001F6242F2|nr:SGNH/GDSL hydrolase family protein [Streptomyces sp. AN091965]MCI3935523.1 SGNH/GDSL hydrolase family protein [Streptomyces sp. AN091965]
MHTETTTSPRRARRTRRRHPLLLASLLTTATAVALTGCGAGSDSADTSGQGTPAKTGKRVLWMGDSIAGSEAPALGAALKASGVAFKDASSTGGGTVVTGDRMAGQIARTTWKDLAENITSFRPNVIAYQITTYDWGTSAQQRASYVKLAKTAHRAGAELVLVSAPPFKIDDFYRKYEGAIRSAPKAAKQVAAAADGKVRFLDADALWGTDATADKAQRSADGVHSCQQGSAAFARWFTDQLGKELSFEPAAPEKWAKGRWTADKRFGKLGCG